MQFIEVALLFASKDKISNVDFLSFDVITLIYLFHYFPFSAHCNIPPAHFLKVAMRSKFCSEKVDLSYYQLCFPNAPNSKRTLKNRHLDLCTSNDVIGIFRVV